MKSLIPISVSLAFVLLVVCLDARDSFAQRATGGFGGMQPGMGGMQGGMGGMQGGMGMGGMGQQRMGMGGMGQGGMGMGGMGQQRMGGMQGGMQGGMGMGRMGMGNQQLRQMQQMGMAGGAMGPNAFIGGDAATTQGFFQNLGVGQRPMSQNLMIENLNERRADRGQQVGRGAEPPPVRVQLRPAFDTPAMGSTMVTNNIRTRLQQRLEGRNVTGVDIQIAGRNATLVGTVSSEHERALLARLVRMEPGISQVENQLVVEPPTE